jgi:hypothetical protein
MFPNHTQPKHALMPDPTPSNHLAVFRGAPVDVGEPGALSFDTPNI